MKKRIILISISFVLVILSIVLLFTKLNNKVNVVDFSNNETIIKKENPITNNKDIITIEEKDNNKKEKTKEEINNSNTNNTINNNTNNNSSTNNTNNTINNNTNNNPNPKIPTTPTITYSCPDGFELQGESCYQTITAEASCPNNMVNTDHGCISFSEKESSTDGSTCPNGYWGLAEIHIDGTPDEFYCHPLHNYIYNCPEGYNLNNNMCTKVIPANRN